MPDVARRAAERPEILEEVEKEDEDARRNHIGADRRDQIEWSPAHCRNVRVCPARHAHQSRDVHGEECDVHADEHEPERNFSQALRQWRAGSRRSPVVEGREQREDHSPDQHVMKVGDYEIRVMDLPIEGHHGDHDACEPPQREDEEEAENEVCRCAPTQAAGSDRGQPRKHLYPAGNGYRHAGRGEEAQRKLGNSCREHVVDPQPEGQEPCGDDGQHDQAIGDERCLHHGGYDHRHHAGGWEENNVHLGVAKKPEEVLPQQRIATFFSNKERPVKRALELEQQSSPR